MIARVWPVAILTRNGAATLARALDSLAAARDGQALDVLVLANGCSDRTAEIARAWRGDGVAVRVLEIARGDKANAWNAYVHEHAGDSPVHFFMDGDIEVEPSALRKLAEALREPAVLAGAVPGTGRDRAGAIARMIAHSRVAGGLYALAGDFVAELRRNGVRLPIGWIGEDFLISWIAKGGWRVAGRFEPSARVAIVTEARYRFRSLTRHRPGDVAIYFRRIVRYELRTRQFLTLFERPQEEGLPAEVGELYARSPHHTRPRWVGPYTPMVLLAVLLMWRERRRWRRAHADDRTA